MVIALRGGVGGRRGIIVDLNYMYRVPLWPTGQRDSQLVGSWQVRQIPVLDIHELAAGKLATLLPGLHPSTLAEGLAVKVVSMRGSGQTALDREADEGRG